MHSTVHQTELLQSFTLLQLAIIVIAAWRSAPGREKARAIGIVMNTRVPMELVVINIGLAGIRQSQAAAVDRIERGP